MNTALLAAVLMARGQSPGLAAKIEQFSSVGQSVEANVKRLAEMSGETLIVTGPISREPLFVEVKDCTVKELMDKIATATYAEWRDANGALTLTQGNEAQVVSGKAKAARIADIRQVVAKKAAEYRKKPWGQGSAAEYANQVEKSRDRFKNSFMVPEGQRPRVSIYGTGITGPIDELMAAVITQLSPEMLEGLKPGQRVVLSTSPNRMQSAFGGNISQAVANYVRAIAEIYEESVRQPRKDYGADWEGSLSFPKQRDISISKVNIVVQRDGELIVGEMQLVGPNGQDLGNKSTVLNVETQPETDEPEKPADTDAPSIRLSGVSQEFQGLSGNFSRRGAMSMVTSTDDGLVRVDAGQAPSSVRPSSALSPFFNRPGSMDLMGLFVPECLDELAKGGDYVAVLPDYLWSRLLGSAKSEAILRADVDKIFGEETEMKVVDGVTVWRSSDPLETQNQRIDRQAMQRLTDKVHTVGFGHVKDVATYVVERGREVKRGDCDAMLFSVSLPFVSPMLVGFPEMSYDLASVLSSGPDLVTEVPAGESDWKLGQMTGPMQRAFERLVYSRSAGFTDQGGISIGVSMGDRMEPVPMIADREPTERFPNGVSNEVAIHLTIREQQGVLGRLRGHATGQLMTASQLGAITGFIEGLGGANGDMKVTEFEEFLMANTRAIEIMVPGGIASGSFTDGLLADGARPLAYNELGTDFLQRGQAIREQMREAAEDMRKNQQKAPPP